MPQTQTAPPSMNLQGIVVPSAQVNPGRFAQLTRRLHIRQKTGAFAGIGGSDNIPILETGIVSGISVKFSGTLTTTKGTGAIGTTSRWPYDLMKSCRFAANGQSNLINCGGWPLKAREFMDGRPLSDRGVAQGVGGASPGTARTQGTLSLGSELWGVGQNVSAIADGAYPVELSWFIPVAIDQVSLMGAIFAQTSATDLNLTLDWATNGDLFTLTSNAAVALTGSLLVEAIVYSIPTENGGIVVPDLSVYHALIQTRYNAIANGENEVKLSGQGVGRQLMRVLTRVFNGAAPTPLAVNATNFGNFGWRFGGNDTPEIWGDGQSIRYDNERLYSCDIGGLQGFAALDFASQWMARDSIDEGSATELRALINIPGGVSLTTPFLEYVQETLVAGAAGA